MFSYREYRAYRRWRRNQQHRAIMLTALAIVLIAAFLHAAGTHTRHQATTHGHPRISSLRHQRRSPHARRPRHGHRASTTRAELTAAGTGLHWVDFYGIELPTSAHDGPRYQRHGLARGFTDTPRGALLAAVNIAVRTAALWGPNIYGPTIRDQVTGPDKTALLAAAASDYSADRAASGVKNGAPAGRGYAAETGFRFISYTPAAATVEIVSQGPGTGGTSVLAATRVQVLWRHGDWQVLAPPGGDWASSATAITSPAGYTPLVNKG